MEEGNLEAFPANFITQKQRRTSGESFQMTAAAVTEWAASKLLPDTVD